MAESIQAQITASIKTALRLITKANGYNYDVASVEQARKILEINDRFEYLLLLENEPLKDDESMIIHELQYPVWFFSDQNDRLIGDPGDTTKDVDTEISYYNRNAIADITKAVNVDITRGNLAENTEIIPGTHDHYVSEDSVLFGTWCMIRVKTNIDAQDPYKLRF